MNEQDFNTEEEFKKDTGNKIPFQDKRRFDDDGTRVDVEIKDGAEIIEEDHELPTSPEIVKLEKALKEMTIRCEAAETKLGGVQKRFEEEKAKLERETSERRERMKKSLEQKADQGRFNFLIALLPVLDNLNLAISASEEDSSLENLLAGVKGTARSFEQALLNVGVKPIASVNELFNPELHEAVDMVETDDENDGKIMAEYAKGFTFNDRLLRPARVQVGNATNTKKASE